MKIVGSPEVEAAMNKTPNPHNLNILIQQVLESLPVKDEVFIHRVVPGRSGALVCLALTGSFGTPNIPIIIKYGPYALISTEAENYQTYVGPKLKTAPSLLPSKPISNREMAIAYELAGWTKSPDHLITYRDYFNRTDSGMLVTPLIPILRDLESWWGSCKVSKDTIFDCYKIYSEKILADSFKSLCKDKVFGHFLTGNPFLLLDFWRSWEISWPFTSTLRSIVHGDLNSTNILIDTEYNTAAVIDFTSIRPDGHILMDLAKMEREIRCRLLGLEKGDFEQHLSELENLETTFFHNIAQLKITMDHRYGGPMSEPCFKAFSALMNIYNKAFVYFSKFYPNKVQFLSEFYLSIFFQTILVVMFPSEDYPGQKVAAVNSCFRLRDFIQDILNMA